MIEEETKSEWEEDVDAAIEKAITMAARTEKAKRSLRKIIVSITTKQLATTTHPPTTVKKTPTKSHVPTPRVTSKRKWAQPSEGATTM